MVAPVRLSQAGASLFQLAGRADEVVAASGESWITEMSHDELFKLFTLEL